MADTRPADDPVDALAQLQQTVADLQATLNARVSRRPTGTLEKTMLTAAPADALLLNGATVNRADYPGLWQWVSDNSRIGAGLFGAGDGSTTFVLPDWRGLVPRMPASGGVVGEKLGADSRVLSTANLPSHDHNVSVATHGNHGHDLTGGTGTANGGGAHGGHFPAGSHLAAAGPDLGLAAWNDGGVGSGTHTHSVNTSVFADAASAGGHSVNESSVGSGTAVDVRQASVGVNYMIWT